MDQELPGEEVRKLVFQADDLRGFGANSTWDAKLLMYYDETNNIRRLRLTELGLNDPSNKNFAIAGIALKPGTELSGWPELRKAMNIQASAQEVKFKHVAPSDYEDAIGSPKLLIFLEWLIQSDVLIHYSGLDVLYWSILDIVESLQADERIDINRYHAELKNELYFAVTLNPAAFMKLLHGFGYPNLKRKDVSSFLSCVFAFVNRWAPKSRNTAMRALKDLLRKAPRLKGLELPFLHDEEEGELIQDFSGHFMRPLYAFKHATHVLDRETHIEEIMRRREIRDGERLVDYRFADSVDEVGIQAADVFAGLIGRHFTYVQHRTLPELRGALSRFSPDQLKGLGLLRELIHRSDAFSDGLLHRIHPRDTDTKNDFFLHGRLAPRYLG